MAANGDWVRKGTRALGVISACAALAALSIYWDVRNLPAPGDISGALSNHPSAYTLSLGHMLDLTLPSFAYLRVPLIIAAIAALVFLVLLHKLEYFLNSKIIGDRIKNPVWLTLLALIIGERFRSGSQQIAP